MLNDAQIKCSLTKCNCCVFCISPSGSATVLSRVNRMNSCPWRLKWCPSSRACSSSPISSTFEAEMIIKYAKPAAKESTMGNQDGGGALQLFLILLLPMLTLLYHHRNKRILRSVKIWLIILEKWPCLSYSQSHGHVENINEASGNESCCEAAKSPL